MITTPVFKYYHQRGMLLTNVEYVVQYSYDRPLADFVSKMTQCRIQATRDNLDELAQLYKVFKILVQVQ